MLDIKWWNELATTRIDNLFEALAFLGSVIQMVNILARKNQKIVNVTVNAAAGVETAPAPTVDWVKLQNGWRTCWTR